MHADTAAILNRIAAEDPAAGARVDEWVAKIQTESPPDQALLVGMVSYLRLVLAERGPDETRATGAALARFGELAQRPLIAELGRSERLVELLAALRPDSAHLTADEPLLATVPTDLPDFRWGAAVSHGVENTAFWHAAAALENAQDQGELAAGTPGWQARRQKIVTTTVESEVLLDGEATSFRRGCLDERLMAWRNSKSARRGELTWLVVREFEFGLRAPADVGQVMAPFRWLIDRLAGGVAADRKGRLPKDVVGAAVQQFGWPAGGGARRLLGPDRDHADLLAAMARSAGLVELNDGTLATTDLGRVANSDAEELWRAVTSAALVSGSWWANAVEVPLLLLLEQSSWTYLSVIGELEGVLRETVDPKRERADLDWGVAAVHALEHMLAYGRVLGFLDIEGRMIVSRSFTLTESGRWTVLALLHGRATGPVGWIGPADQAVKRPPLPYKDRAPAPVFFPS